MGTRVYIGRLSPRVRERELERFFKNYGRIKEIILKNGYGFVEFEDYRDADDAAYECNGKELGGDRITVELARGTPRGRDRAGWRGPPPGSYAPPPPRYAERSRKPQRTDYRLIVENLSSRISWQDLKDFMRQAGEVTYCDSHPSRNEGIVEFATKKDMQRAMEKFENHELKGRKIRLKEERPMRRSRSTSRRRSPSRSRSASRSKSRSRSAKRSKSRTPRGRSKDEKRKSVSASPHRSESGSPEPKPSAKRESLSPVQRKRSHSRSRSDSPHRSPSGSQSPPAKAPKEENGGHSDRN